MIGFVKAVQPILNGHVSVKDIKYLTPSNAA